MTTTTGATTADRQRLRAARGTGGKPNAANRLPSPPRQRRPAMAALALVLIVGGALVAGLLAIRMDSRVDVLVANGDIAPGTPITEDNVTTTPVAYDDDVNLIPEDQADLVIGTFAKGFINDGTLIDGKMLDRDNPIGGDRAIVSVVLNPALAPEKELETGALVEIVRASGSSSTGEGAAPITQGLVLSIHQPKKDSLSSGAAGSASLLVPAASAADVIDASSANLAGLALISRGNTTDDVTLSGS
jgi:hypothetical protein